MSAPHVRVAIVGTGFAGLGTAVRLLQAGMDDFVLLERADEVGGTWRDNTYPGCACDVPSNLYSFSFAPNPRWTHHYARQPEILAYLREVADRFGVRPHVRFRHELRAAEWDAADALWRLDTAGGPFTANFVVSGHGPLVDPKWPALPGLDTFAGPRFHSARWDHSVDLAGKRVAVIGTGASAIQFVPAIAPEVGHLTVYQRSAPWIMPRLDRAFTPREREAFERRPVTQLAARAAVFARTELGYLAFATSRVAALAAKTARAHLEAQVSDPDLRAKLTPDYRYGCKRVLVSDDYYPALTRPNVELVADPLREVRPHGVVTADGVERPADVLIGGTGFNVTRPPIGKVFRGEGGRTLDEVWGASPQAYLGTSVAGFPNLFLLVGPNTGLGHTSIVYMIESQVAYVLAALRHAERGHFLALDVKPEAQAAYNGEVQAALKASVWQSEGCRSWYLDEHGRNTSLWPGFAFQFRRRLARFDPAAYRWRLSPAPLRPAFGGKAAGARP